MVMGQNEEHLAKLLYVAMAVPVVIAAIAFISTPSVWRRVWPFVSRKLYTVEHRKREDAENQRREAEDTLRLGQLQYESLARQHEIAVMTEKSLESRNTDLQQRLKMSGEHIAQLLDRLPKQPDDSP